MKKILFLTMLLACTIQSGTNLDPEKIDTIKHLLIQLAETPKLPSYKTYFDAAKIDAQATREKWSECKDPSISNETYWNLVTRDHAKIYIAYIKKQKIYDDFFYNESWDGIATDLDQEWLDHMTKMPLEICWYCLDNRSKQHSLSDLRRVFHL